MRRSYGSRDEVCYELKKAPDRPPDKCCTRKKACYIVCGMTIAVMVIVIALVGAMVAITAVNGFPLHASCKVTWNFGVPCQNASDAIVHQIKLWNGPEGCKQGGQKCLYTLTSRTGLTIKAKHETPVKHYVDDLTFDFKPATEDEKQKSGNGTALCTGKGFSTSETWYALLDYGTNYCNLHNLITGSGLDKIPGYEEMTSNSKCTQYSVADCSKY